MPKEWKSVSVPLNSLVHRSEKSSLFKFPEGTIYADYTFNIPNKLYKESTELVDMQSDSRVSCFQIIFTQEFKFKLISKNVTKEINADEFANALKDHYHAAEHQLKEEKIIEQPHLKDYQEKTEKKLRAEAAAIKSGMVPASEYYAQKNLMRLQNIEKNMPMEMKSMDNWCVFKTFYDSKTGSRKKIILNCKTGGWASSINPDTWSTFDSALKYARENKCEGLAFALRGSKITCIDLDKCIASNGKRSELSWAILNKAKDTYAEKSISGQGLHVLFKGDFLSEYKTNGLGIEAFNNKFISLTGNLVSKTNHIAKCDEELQSFLKERLGKKESISSGVAGISHQTDGDVIDRIRNSKMSELFSRLYQGENVKNDASVSDYTLLNILAFFTNADATQMERIFKSSGLYREKKGQAYLNRSINKAIETLCKKPEYTNKTRQSVGFFEK